MFNILVILLSVHFLVDYFMQNNEFINKKNELNFTIRDFYKHPFIIHIALQFMLSFIILFMYIPDSSIFIIYLIFGFLLHGFIDLFKIFFKRKSSTKYRSILYILDQGAHIVILLVVSYMIEKYFSQSIFFQEITDNILFFKYVLAVILITKVANVTFKEVFGKFSGDTISGVGLVNRKKRNTNSTRFLKTLSDDNGNEKAGAIIGSMERLLIFICLSTNNFATIGFVLAAKSVARFKKLDEQKFGEYFIIGTLFSILFTIGVFYMLFKVF